MSHGAKVALIVGGVLVVGYLFISRSSTAAALAPTATTGGALAPAPGAAPSASTLSTVNSTVQSGASSVTRTALVTGGQTALAIATGGLSLLATTSTGRSIVKGVAGGVKTGFVDTYHAIASIL